MKNTDIRALIAKEGLYVYQVAAAMNLKPNTISHYLMNDLSKPQKDRINGKERGGLVHTSGEPRIKESKEE